MAATYPFLQVLSSGRPSLLHAVWPAAVDVEQCVAGPALLTRGDPGARRCTAAAAPGMQPEVRW